MATPRSAIQLAGTCTTRMLVLTAAFPVSLAFFAQRQLISVLSLVDGAFSGFSVFLLHKISLEKTGKRLSQAPFPLRITRISKNYCIINYTRLPKTKLGFVPGERCEHAVFFIQTEPCLTKLCYRASVNGLLIVGIGKKSYGYRFMNFGTLNNMLYNRLYLKNTCTAVIMLYLG